MNVLLRAKLYPVVFCGNHKLEFTTKPGKMKALEGETGYNRVVVKHGGTDENGASVTYTEDLSQTDQYGELDWTNVGMAFREFGASGKACCEFNQLKGTGHGNCSCAMKRPSVRRSDPSDEAWKAAMSAVIVSVNPFRPRDRSESGQPAE